LDGAETDGDRELTFWLNLFRGRALSVLGHFQESADAYRKASALYPGAQSAGIGLALQLFRLDQTTDADNVARAVRRASGDDPWSDYSAADSRFISEHLGRLRKTIQ
jgi:cytochrome c-type biogenesis protein CcmH/NrfG